MPFALVTIGLLMIVTGARGTHRCFALELQSDFTGPPNQNFIWWVAAIGGIGAIGYIPALRPVAKWLIALVLIVMVLAQHRNTTGGFFGQLVDALKRGPEAIDPASCGGAPATAAKSATAENAAKAAALKGSTIDPTKVDVTQIGPITIASSKTRTMGDVFSDIFNPVSWFKLYMSGGL